VAVEDTVSTSREEEEFQLKESEYEHSSEEPEAGLSCGRFQTDGRTDVRTIGRCPRGRP
jgi:hypothetical protein